MPELMHANHIGLGHEEVGSELRLRVMQEMVAGAAVEDISGAVTLDLADGYVFLTRMTGAITELGFSNVPTGTTAGASWLLLLSIDSTGDYAFASTASLTWVDGSSWDDLDLSANAVNVIQFVRVNGVTYASLVWNGALSLEPYKMCFIENGSITLVTENEDIDVANDSQAGDGTITYARDSGGGFGSITTRTTFDQGDTLRVTCASATGTTTVRIPRYVA